MIIMNRMQIFRKSPKTTPTAMIHLRQTVTKRTEKKLIKMTMTRIVVIVMMMVMTMVMMVVMMMIMTTTAMTMKRLMRRQARRKANFPKFQNERRNHLFPERRISLSVLKNYRHHLCACLKLFTANEFSGQLRQN